MTVTAQNGFLAYAPQNLKSTEVGYDVPTAIYRHRAYDVTFGAVQDQRQFPLEVGGINVPTGAFKAGAFVAGGARITPRLEGDFGWLLLGVLGEGSDGGSGSGGDTGVYKHVFTFADDSSYIPWMQVEKYIPGQVEALLERGIDCKLTQLGFTVPQSGLVVAEPVWVGRVPSWVEDPTLPGIYEDFEGPSSVPISARGSLTINSVALPAVGATITIANNLTSPQQEMIIGEYYPDDFVPLSRAVQIRFTYKWADPDFYQQIMANSASGLEWAPPVFYGPADLTVESPGNIPTKTVPYSLRVFAQNVSWAADGPPQLQGGNIIAQDYIGTVNDNNGGEYFRAELVNTQATYVWPT